MELKDKMMRSVARNVAEKAIEDMKTDPMRSVRRMIDMAALFSHGEQQKQFFARAEQIAQNTNSPYKNIAAHLANNIDSEHLIRFGLNFGYNGFSYGANILRKTAKKTGIEIPWLLEFELSDSFDSHQTEQLKNTIEEARDLGIYTYIFHTSSADDHAEELCSVAAEYQDCAFFVAGGPTLFSDAFLNRMQTCLNVLYCMHISDTSDSAAIQTACNRLLATKRIFGCYSEEVPCDRLFAEKNILAQLQAYGFYFVIFHHKNLCDAEVCYQTILSLRENGKETIIPAELDRDADHIQSMIYGSNASGILTVGAEGVIKIGDSEQTANLSAGGLLLALQKLTAAKKLALG
jgi:hypothetical protein